MLQLLNLFFFFHLQVLISRQSKVKYVWVFYNGFTCYMYYIYTIIFICITVLNSFVLGFDYFCWLVVTYLPVRGGAHKRIPLRTEERPRVVIKTNKRLVFALITFISFIATVRRLNKVILLQSVVPTTLAHQYY